MKYIRNCDGAFACSECTFVTAPHAPQSTMFYHMKKHTGEKPHVCSHPGCEMSFVQKSGLTQHMLTHGGGDGLACPCCDHSSKTKANLLIHIGRKHGESWIPAMKEGRCTGCNKICSSVTAYCYHAVRCFDAPDEIRSALEA